VKNLFKKRGRHMDWKYEKERIYSVDEKGELMAETTYVLKENGEVNIDHTYVNPVLRGQGVAGRMMELVAQYFREKGLKVTATCSYANMWLKRHRESYSDIISKDLDREIISCKIDNKHQS
jgi:predicted GNAT family acetyltransferase